MQSLEAYKEQPTQGRWSKQNSKLVKVTLGEEAFARRGSMVAYQGDIEFGFKGPGGLKTFFEGKMTGQALSLMVCKGSGEVFLAENATDLHVVDLAGRTLCVMAKNILAFDATVQVQIQRLESAGLPGGGLYFLQLSGQGSVVVMTRGTPMSLPVVGPTHADVNAAVAWSAGMRVSVTSQVRVVRTVYAGVSGEANNLQFMAMDGEHFVVVQPFEV